MPFHFAPVVTSYAISPCAGLIKQTSLLSDAFAEQRRMVCYAIHCLHRSLFVSHRLQVLVASTCKKPSDADLQKILAPTAAKMGDIEKCKDNRSEVKEHLNTVAEGAGDCCFRSTNLRLNRYIITPVDALQRPCPGCSWSPAPASRRLFLSSPRRYLSWLI
jgi:hypothetical protein